MTAVAKLMRAGRAPRPAANHGIRCGKPRLVSKVLRRTSALAPQAPPVTSDAALEALPGLARLDLEKLLAKSTSTAKVWQHVLHIDSDGDAATAVAALLLPEIQVTHVSSVAAARRLMARSSFSLIVLDPALPDGDGASLLRAAPATPVLVYASSRPKARDPVWKHAGWRACANAFLPKTDTSYRQLYRALTGLLSVAEAD